MGKIIAEIVLIIWGGFIALFPNVMVRFQVWIQRVLMNAQYIPSDRTFTAMRIVGVFLLLLGIAVFFGLHK
jgi:hypothetical protein